MGIKVVSGDINSNCFTRYLRSSSMRIEATGVAVSYKLANGITLGAYIVKSDDDMDAGEKYDASGVEAQYTIAAGLTAVVNMNDYDY